MERAASEEAAGGYAPDLAARVPGAHTCRSFKSTCTGRTGSRAADTGAGGAARPARR